MTVRTSLARLGGADAELAEQAGDLTKQAAMGGVLLSTALVAGVSAFFALNTALHLAWPAAVLAGGVWAAVILNLDRMLVVSMSGLSGVRLKLIAVVPRLLLAIVIGAVISTPLTLRIFAPEIDAQLDIMHAQQLNAARNQLNTTYADIPGLQSQVARLQQIISGQLRPSVSDDPDVRTAQAAYDSAEQTYQSDQAAAQCELNGDCGSHHAGTGPAYRQAQTTADAAAQQAQAALQALDTAKQQAATRLGTAAAQDVANARAQLPNVQDQLNAETAAKQAADGANQAADNADSGLLSQLEALEEITSGHPTALLAHLMLFLLFLFIEVLPVLAKLLSTLGDPSAYDDLIAQRDQHARKLKRLALDAELRAAETRAQAEADVAAHELAERTAHAKEAATKLAEIQARMAQKAMDTWAELAKHRMDAELDAWIEANTADQPPTPAPVNQPVGGPPYPARPSRHAMPTDPAPAFSGHRRSGPAEPSWADEQTVRLPAINGHLPRSYPTNSQI